uniref:EGF-like domain-containing protein n=1 Tax=Syphacia muris TaxID=451379 RepID=A0A0N5AF50_9BILA
MDKTAPAGINDASRRGMCQPSTSSEVSSLASVQYSGRSVKSDIEENDYDVVPEYYEREKVFSDDSACCENYSILRPYTQRVTPPTKHRSTSKTKYNCASNLRSFPLPNAFKKSLSTHQVYSVNDGRRSSGVHITPSPSDSGIVDYETIIRDKENELNNVRTTMEQNEEIIIRVYQEKERVWEEEIADLKQKLQASQQGENALRLQIQLCNEQRDEFQTTINNLINDKGALQEKCFQLEREVFRFRELNDELKKGKNLICHSCQKSIPDDDSRRAKAPVPAPRSHKELSPDKDLRAEVDQLRAEVSSLRETLGKRIGFFSGERPSWDNVQQIDLLSQNDAKSTSTVSDVRKTSVNDIRTKSASKKPNTSTTSGTLMNNLQLSNLLPTIPVTDKAATTNLSPNATTSTTRITNFIFSPFFTAATATRRTATTATTTTSISTDTDTVTAVGVSTTTASAITDTIITTDTIQPASIAIRIPPSVVTTTEYSYALDKTARATTLQTSTAVFVTTELADTTNLYSDVHCNSSKNCVTTEDSEMANPCSTINCKNGGRCEVDNNVASCKCPNNTLGRFCEQAVCVRDCNCTSACIINDDSLKCQCNSSADVEVSCSVVSSCRQICEHHTANHSSTSDSIEAQAFSSCRCFDDSNVWVENGKLCTSTAETTVTATVTVAPLAQSATVIKTINISSELRPNNSTTLPDSTLVQSSTVSYKLTTQQSEPTKTIAANNTKTTANESRIQDDKVIFPEINSVLTGENTTSQNDTLYSYDLNKPLPSQASPESNTAPLKKTYTENKKIQRIKSILQSNANAQKAANEAKLSPSISKTVIRKFSSSWSTFVLGISAILAVFVMAQFIAVKHVCKSRRLRGRYHPASEEIALCSDDHPIETSSVGKDERLI